MLRTSQNDFISWLLEDAIGEERTVHNLVLRVLSTNFAALHTTSMVRFPPNSNIFAGAFIFVSSCPQMFTHAIFDLMTRPELMQPLREEAERVVAEEGWTKNTVNNMVKIDSFLRETQRLRTMAPSMRSTHFLFLCTQLKYSRDAPQSCQ